MTNNYLATPDGLKLTPGKHHEKLWGSELHIYNVRHCVKLMTLKPNFSCSLHFHSHKDETFLLVSGVLIVEVTNSKGTTTSLTFTNQGDTITIEKNVPHRFYTPRDQEENTIFIESSTFDSPNDSFRIEPSRKREEED